MRKPNYRAVWIEMLLEAQYSQEKKKSVLWKGKQYYLSPGEFTCGAKQLAEWTGVRRGTVERIIKTFKSEEQIEVRTSNQFSLYKILNWELYQNSEEQNEEPVRNQRGAGEEPVRTPKERKKERTKESKKYIFKIFKKGSVEYSTAEYFSNKRVEYFGETPKKPNLQEWANQFSKIISERITAKHVMLAIEAAFSHPFWSQRITEPKHLAEHWTAIIAAGKGEYEKKKKEEKENRIWKA